jgi:hypothetical protein
VVRPADAFKQRRVCSQTAGRLGGASAPRHIRRGPPRPTRRPRMANVSGACRAQEPVTRPPSGRGAEDGSFGLRLLAGVFVVECFCGCDGRRRDSRTCALWDRVFARPGQTDPGWPKKVSRRVQEPVALPPSGRGAEGERFGLGLLAGVFVVECFCGCDGRRRDSRTCALWDRVFARPGQTDAGWPKKVSRRAQESVTCPPSGRGAEGDGFGLRLLAGVFVVEGFAGCDGRRRNPRTCALWDRVFARPGQTDAGWPEKVSRRAQEPVTHLSSGRGA